MAYGPLLFQLASFLCEKSLLKCGFHRICTSFIFFYYYFYYYFLVVLLFVCCFCCCCCCCFCVFIPRYTTIAGYYGITLAVRVSVRLSVRLSYVRPSVFSFPDDNLCGCQWIFAKLDACIDIVEILFGIVYGQISSIFARETSVFSFPGDN